MNYNSNNFRRQIKMWPSEFEIISEDENKVNSYRCETGDRKNNGFCYNYCSSQKHSKP